MDFQVIIDFIEKYELYIEIGLGVIFFIILFIVMGKKAKKKKALKSNAETNKDEEKQDIVEKIPTKEVETTSKPKKPKTTSKKKLDQTKYLGKYEITLRRDGYHFTLIASNGQILFDSYAFTTAQGALSGIDTFKKAVEEDDFVVYKDKFNRYRYILSKRYIGENYDNKASCENGINSVKRFAFDAQILHYASNPEKEKLYEETKKEIKPFDEDFYNKFLSQDIKPLGKYEFEKGPEGYHFYLIANNGQLLYTSRPYTTLAGAQAGIETFKKAVFGENFFIEEDKFGKFRFILRGAGSTGIYSGESFTTKESALNNVESVKKFAFSAVITAFTE
ncbi:MAG: DUF1508 domain-containing protein [Bacilli bacterium]